MSKLSNYTAKTPEPDGRIIYTDEENAVWRDLFGQQFPNVKRHMARPYLEGLEKLDLPKDKVPQCPDITARLMDLTGWSVAPVPALIGFKQFFGMLASQTFPAASFIRSRQDFNYIKEPDIFHEVFGHTPLLADPRFAGFSQAIGQAGVKAEPQDYAWLIRLYWFTIEFGLLRQDGEIKALGSGLASSPTELPYSVTNDVAERCDFDVIDILRTPYRIDIHQPVYFVLDGVDQLFEAANRDLLDDIQRARKSGLHKAKFVSNDSDAA